MRCNLGTLLALLVMWACLAPFSAEAQRELSGLPERERTYLIIARQVMKTQDYWKVSNEEMWAERCQPLIVDASLATYEGLPQDAWLSIEDRIENRVLLECDLVLFSMLNNAVMAADTEVATMFSATLVRLAAAINTVETRFAELSADGATDGIHIILMAAGEAYLGNLQRSKELICLAAAGEMRMAETIISELSLSDRCANLTGLPERSTGPGQDKPATKLAPPPASPPSPPPPPISPPLPPPPAVTVKPAPAPPPPPAQQGEIEAVTSPVPGYTNCRRIPLDYYDPDGKLVSESMVMCQDRNGEFIEVTGAQ